MMPINDNSKSMVRLVQMLQLIPKSPSQITVADLTAELTRLGFAVGERTVQRDLNDLACQSACKNDQFIG
jgi:predicted DNA-binding transcriptional regulator YafY